VEKVTLSECQVVSCEKAGTLQKILYIYKCIFYANTSFLMLFIYFFLTDLLMSLCPE
jgi:hypothetical protein